MEPPILPSTSRHPAVTDSRIQQMKDVSVRLEAAFLSEMLKSAGLGNTSDAFGGGAGEEQYGSFLVDAQALEIARAGGIGLSETIFNQLKERYENDIS